MTGDNELQVIYVLDDDTTNLMLVQDILEAGGFTVRGSSDQQQVLAWIDADVPPTILISDVMMPGLNGFEVCALVRERYTPAQVAVLLMTVLDAASHRMDGLNSGADDFIEKPIDPAHIIARVRSIRARQALLG